MGDDLRSAVFLAGMGKIRVVLESIMDYDRLGNMLLIVFLQPFEMYVLCINYYSGTQIDK